MLGFIDHYRHIRGALGELGEVYGVILIALDISIDAGFRTHESDVGVSGYQSRHDFVRPGTVYQSEIDAFVLKIAELDGGILGRIEDGVGDFV